MSSGSRLSGSTFFITIIPAYFATKMPAITDSFMGTSVNSNG
ncbi:hypothetical protein ES703_85535 [subsurface metagenome]